MMKAQRLSYKMLLSTIGLMGILLFVAGCSSVPAAAPVAVAPAETATTESPTVPPPTPVAPTPMPSTATLTPVPPTATPTPIPPTVTPAAQPTPPADNWFDSVWGSSGSNVFAVGTDGRILHYNGIIWSPMSSDKTYKTYELVTVWGNSGSDIFVAGFGGTILHYDGNVWSPMSSGKTNPIAGVWGSSDNDVFAVGTDGTILHYNGTAWSPMNSGTSADLIGIWGKSGSDIFVVGSGGTILHYDGKTWSPMDSGTSIILWGVWGSSERDIFAAGDRGKILHYDGKTWSPMDSGTHSNLDGIGSVWGTSGNDVFAFGSGGTILHYDGKIWSPMNSGTDNTIEKVWGSSGNDVFAVGDYDMILHYDGKTWSPMEISPAAAPVAEAPAVAPTPTPVPQPTESVMPPGSYINSIWGSSDSDVFAVGYDGNCCDLLFHYDGTTWSVISSGKTPPLAGAWGTSGSDIFAVGVDGTILHYDGSAWSPMDSGTSNILIGIWGNSGSDIFVVGFGGTILHYNGTAWSPLDSKASVNLWGVWGSSESDVFAAGDGGIMRHYDGKTWSLMESGTSNDLGGTGGVWGSSGSDVFVPGTNGTILHYDGKTWSPMNVSTNNSIEKVWGKSGNDVFAVGDNGTILHYDGKTWSPMDSGTSECIHTVWGSSGNNVFAAGEFPSILHYDGKTWSPMEISPAATPVAEAPATTTASLDSALVTRIETGIEKLMKMKTNQTPGLAISIIKDKQVVYSKGFGLAEAGTDRAVTPETVFQLGSNSKMMVAIAIMQLKEQGKIDLDAPVTNYLPYFQLADEQYKEITIRHLLSHQSGLPFSSGAGSSADYTSPEYDEGSLERHVRNLTGIYLNSAPGEQMQYSDLGFEILGDVIAKVSGQSFEDYTQEHIFAPLGMQHTSFMVKDIPPELLAGPHDHGQPLNFFPYSRQYAPSSTLLSNVTDMSRYALAQLNLGQLGETRILPATAYEEMWTPQIDSSLGGEWEKEAGLGWFLGEQKGHRLVGHGGDDWGFSCGFIMAPDDGLAVILMGNRQYSTEAFSYYVMQWLLEEK